jgi:hypothetical protein
MTVTSGSLARNSARLRFWLRVGFVSQNDFRDRSAEVCDRQHANNEETRKPGTAQICLLPPSCVPHLVPSSFG